MSRTNPFATRFIEPGALEYYVVPVHCQADKSRSEQSLEDLSTQSLEGLVAKFRNGLNRRAAVVGPHGTGKSTLLHALVPRLGVLERQCFPDWFTLPKDRSHDLNAKSGDRVRWFQLQSGTATTSQLLSDHRDWTERSIILVDGYEQLSQWQRWRLNRSLKSKGAGLLATAHSRPFGIPALYETPEIESVREIVIRRLLVHQPELIEQALAIPVSPANTTNLREHLFDLYDWFESLDRVG
jgi:hypothetical protein